MEVLGKRKIMHIQLIMTFILFLAVLQTANGEASYKGDHSYYRWSDAAKKCQQNHGGFLAKIKNLAELNNARSAFLQHQDPKQYWIGVKYDTTKNDFVWADKTLVTATADFEAIVNRAEQQTATNKRCLFLTTQDVLVADACQQHKKFICQVGETADAAKTSSSYILQATSTSKSSVTTTTSTTTKRTTTTARTTTAAAKTTTTTAAAKTTTTTTTTTATTTAAAKTTTTTTTTTMRTALTATAAATKTKTTTAKTATTSISFVSSSLSSSLSTAVSSLISPTPLLESLHVSSAVLLKHLPSSSWTHAPHNTQPTVNTVTAQYTPNMVETHASKMKQLNASEPSSLDSAINLTSTLLKDASNLDNGNVNILVSCEKLEKFAMEYANLHMTSQNGSEAEMSIEQEELGMTIMRIPAYHKSDVVFPSNSSSFNESFIQEEKGAITLSASLFNQERYVVCMLYKNAAELMPEGANNVDNREDASIRTRIISCAVEPEVQGVFEDDVIIKLTNKKGNSTAIQSNCVFWDFSLRTKFDGAWSQEGCKLVQETEEDTTCSCNHLTNFAVLMEVGETKISDDHKFALEMVTYIGIALSLVGEIITVLIYLVLMNLKSIQSHIRLNLVICLGIAQLVFMAGIKATEVETLCIVVAITINYFYLVAFGWMLMEGVMLYLKLVKVFNVATSTKVFYVVAWGIPTLVVASAVCINILLNGSMGDSMRDDVCWFSFSSGFIWAFVGSVLVACLVNLVILIRILAEIMRLKDVSGISETHSFRQSLKACVVLFPLLGLTWIFGVLTVTDAGLVFQYLFTVLNSLQGLFIFLFHVVRSKEIRTALETKKQRWETSRSVSIANEKTTLGKGRSSAVKQKHVFMIMNKISPEPPKSNTTTLTTVG